MPQNSQNRKLSRAALCAVFGMTGVLAGSAAVHAGDGDDGMGTRILRSIGLGKGQDSNIEYKERPPLVVPPSSDLPPPVSADAMTVHNTAWPSDPDGKRRTDERRAKRERKQYNAAASSDADKPGQKAGEESQSYVGSMWSSVVGFGKSIGGNSSETKAFMQEPSRDALTDPPVGYRTPSPVQPYGINSKNKPKASETDRQIETVNR
jgi:hypothetical protein